jgi:hypothetical protein
MRPAVNSVASPVWLGGMATYEDSLADISSGGGRDSVATWPASSSEPSAVALRDGPSRPSERRSVAAAGRDATTSRWSKADQDDRGNPDIDSTDPDLTAVHKSVVEHETAGGRRIRLLGCLVASIDFARFGAPFPLFKADRESCDSAFGARPVPADDGQASAFRCNPPAWWARSKTTFLLLAEVDVWEVIDTHDAAQVSGPHERHFTPRSLKPCAVSSTFTPGMVNRAGKFPVRAPCSIHWSIAC